MGKGDNSVVCHADSWMCDDHETRKIICQLDIRVSNPMRHISMLETAVKETMVMLHFSINDTRFCRKELGVDY